MPRVALGPAHLHAISANPAAYPSKEGAALPPARDAGAAAGRDAGCHEPTSHPMRHRRRGRRCPRSGGMQRKPLSRRFRTRTECRGFSELPVMGRLLRVCARPRRAELSRPRQQRTNLQASRCTRLARGQRFPGQGGHVRVRAPEPWPGRPCSHGPGAAGLPEGSRLHALTRLHQLPRPDLPGRARQSPPHPLQHRYEVKAVHRGRADLHQTHPCTGSPERAAVRRLKGMRDPIAEDAGSVKGSGLAALAAAIVLAAGAGWAWRAGAFPATASSGAGHGQPAPATAAVTRRDLAATTPVAGTLGYAGSYAVRGRRGTVTWLPPAGKVIRQGQVLYKIGNGSPVVLLYGRVPDWRAIAIGASGADVSQLNHDLVRLGYAGRADVVALGWDYFSRATAQGVRRLEGHLGVSGPPGSLSLGQVVFEPAALRVATVAGSLGGAASGPVLTATSDRHVVTIPLDTSQKNEVQAGDTVTVTLPDGTTTPGVVSFVGTVATTSASGQYGPATTIPVQVQLTDPGAAGFLDQAPVTVNITTGRVKNVLAVPVGALLARSPGRYEVEVAGPRNARRWVRVRVGPVFDDANGLVQVTGALTPGQLVVVPAS